MPLLEAPCLIEAPPKGSANCHKIVAPAQNRSTLVCVLAPGAFSTNFAESVHKYIVQTWNVLPKITMATTTTCFTGDGLGKRLLVWLSWSPNIYRTVLTTVLHEVTATSGCLSCGWIIQIGVIIAVFAKGLANIALHCKTQVLRKCILHCDISGYIMQALRDRITLDTEDVIY